MKRIALAVALLGSASAFAEAIYVSVEHARYTLGKDDPAAVMIDILEPIAGFEVNLKRSDGKPFVKRGGGSPGQKRAVELPQEAGKHQWKGEVKVNLPTGEVQHMPTEFETIAFPPLQIFFKDDDIDLKNRKVRFSIDRPAGKAHLRVVMDTGAVAFDDDVPLSGGARTPLELSWPSAPGNVMVLSVRAFDEHGFENGFESVPWRVEIPHEEVNFDTGKWVVKPDQRKKLDSSLMAINAQLARARPYVKDIKLFIVGHTDSVDSAAYNQTLSLNRAKAIAQYFRERALDVPLYYAGMGESALLVPTPDETDEPRNRRAEYILSGKNPSMKNTNAQAAWKKL